MKILKLIATLIMIVIGQFALLSFYYWDVDIAYWPLSNVEYDTHSSHILNKIYISDLSILKVLALTVSSYIT